MASGRAGAKDLAGSGHFETFRNRFAGFATSDRLRHRTRKIRNVYAIDNCFLSVGDPFKLEVRGFSFNRCSAREEVAPH